LAQSCLDEVHAWTQASTKAVIQLYGYVALAARVPDSAPWGRAFRHVLTNALTPYVSLTLRSHPTATGSTIAVRCSSTVWLESAGGVHEVVGPAEAQANVGGLAWLVDDLARGFTSPVTREMHLEGSVYHNERARLASALLHRSEWP
jgi:hypothetical protein